MALQLLMKLRLLDANGKGTGNFMDDFQAGRREGARLPGAQVQGADNLFLHHERCANQRTHTFEERVLLDPVRLFTAGQVIDQQGMALAHFLGDRKLGQGEDSACIGHGVVKRIGSKDLRLVGGKVENDYVCLLAGDQAAQVVERCLGDGLGRAGFENGLIQVMQDAQPVGLLAQGLLSFNALCVIAHYHLRHGAAFQFEVSGIDFYRYVTALWGVEYSLHAHRIAVFAQNII